MTKKAAVLSVRSSFALLTTTLLISGHARAEDAPVDVKAEAVRLSKEGNEYYKAARYGEALAKFEEAFRTFPAPALALNLSRTEHKLGHCDKAIAYAQTYAGAFGQDSAPESSAWLATVKADCPEVEITSDPAGVTFWIEGVRNSFVSPWKGRLLVGNHPLLARLSGHADQHESIQVVAGQVAQVRLTFGPPAQVAPLTKETPQPSLPASLPPVPLKTVPTVVLDATTREETSVPTAVTTAARPLLRTLGWVGLGVGVAALIAGVGLGVAGHAQQLSVHTSIQSNAPSLLRSGNSEAYGADALFAVAGVLGATGTGLAVAF